jgi:hypothetical protein
MRHAIDSVLDILFGIEPLQFDTLSYRTSCYRLNHTFKTEHEVPHNYYKNCSNYINTQRCCNNLPSVIPTSQFSDYICPPYPPLFSPAHHVDQRQKQTAKLYLSLSAIYVNNCRIGRLIDRQGWLNLMTPRVPG